MNKQELISSVAKESGHTPAAVRSVLDATESVVRGAIAAGDHVFLFGLGKMLTKRRNATVASNFGRSEPVEIKARKVVLFQPSIGLKSAANGK